MIYQLKTAKFYKLPLAFFFDKNVLVQPNFDHCIHFLRNILVFNLTFTCFVEMNLSV